jgi:hypothetical protein
MTELPEITERLDRINIAIAEACGWTDAEIIGKENPTPFGIMPNERNEGDNYRLIPNYCNDLNAMHEAEGFLGPKDYQSFRWILWGLVKRPLVTEWFRAQLSATARQRAEAFLRTIGKWEES